MVSLTKDGGEGFAILSAACPAEKPAFAGNFVEFEKTPALRLAKGTGAAAPDAHGSPGKIYLDFYEISGII